VYTGNDGGVWKSTDGGRTWQDINTFGFLATQFESVAVHPTDPQFTIGGTQDNGTIFQKPDGSFIRADFGDGGYALIDQSATDTEHVTMYHTYFNQTGNLIGFGRVLNTSCATEGEWSFMGIYGGSVDPTVHCDGTTDSLTESASPIASTSMRRSHSDQVRRIPSILALIGSIDLRIEVRT
jgi:hypothetical protein